MNIPVDHKPYAMPRYTLMSGPAFQKQLVTVNDIMNVHQPPVFLIAACDFGDHMCLWSGSAVV
jgi:hypothetical protein